MNYINQMKIKLNNTDTAKLLWKDSPCTLANALTNPTIDQSQRFHYGSIYFKDQVNKPKKVFTEFEKPQLLLLNFRRQIDQVSLRAKKLSYSKGPSSLSRETKQSKKITIPMESKLYEKPPKLQLRHDRHGYRSSYLGQFDVKALTERVRETKRNFSSSHRFDLSRPGNFYPGPGTYFHEQKQTKPFRHTFSERIRINSLKNQ